MGYVPYAVAVAWLQVPNGVLQLMRAYNRFFVARESLRYRKQIRH